MSAEPVTAEGRVRDIFEYPDGPIDDCDRAACANLVVTLMEEHAAAAVAQLTRERDEARAELAELRALLERCEWTRCSLAGHGNHDEAIGLCPVCHGAPADAIDEEIYQIELHVPGDSQQMRDLRAARGHRPNCALAKALGREAT